MKDRLSLGLVAVIVLCFAGAFAMASCDALLASAVRDADPQGTAVPNSSAPGSASDSEGTRSSPISLTAESQRSGKVGKSGAVSYYSFSVRNYATTRIVLNNILPSATLSLQLYNNSDFSSSVTTTSLSSGTGISASSLSTNRTYYLKVINTSGSAATTYSILITQGSEKNEGYLGSPINLTLSSSRACTVGGYSTSPANNSYYSFTTGTVGSIDIILSSSSANLDMTIYSDASHATSVANKTGISAAWNNIVLTPNKLYYLRVSTSSGYYSDVMFSMRINNHVPISDGSVAAPVVLTVGASMISGKLGAGTSGDYISFYKFTASATTHTLTMASISPAGTLDYNLGVLSDYSSFLRSSWGGDGNYVFSYLTIGTVYYLRVANSTSATSNKTYTISIN